MLCRSSPRTVRSHQATWWGSFAALSSILPLTAMPTAGETQSLKFDDDAGHLAIRLLLSEDEALRTSIRDAVLTEVARFVPKGRQAVITIRGLEVDVDITDAPEE